MPMSMPRRWTRSLRPQLMTSREISVFGVYFPAVMLTFIAGALISLVANRLLSRTRFCEHVWHPSLFRASLMLCICCALGLTIYS
ncbi:DUF1656 domain-containing protein [Burkholderia cenocepacia]|nr:DUF1656 domain-containing protein [Burkholderia cenocepacia]